MPLTSGTEWQALFAHLAGGGAATWRVDGADAGHVSLGDALDRLKDPELRAQACLVLASGEMVVRVESTSYYNHTWVRVP